jgi:hypothetical protein
MDIESKTVSADGKIADMFRRVNLLIALKHKVDIGGRRPRMVTTMEPCHSNGVIAGATRITLIHATAEYQGQIKVSLDPRLVDIPLHEPSTDAQNRVRTNVRLKAKQIGDLDVHNLMSNIVDVFVAQGAIIKPGPVTKVVDIHFRGFVYSQETHRFINGYFPTHGRTKCMLFEIDRSFTKELKTRRRLTRE